MVATSVLLPWGGGAMQRVAVGQSTVASDESADLALRTRRSTLQLRRLETGEYGIAVRLNDRRSETSYTQDAPLAIEVVDAKQQSQWLAGAYSAVAKQRNVLRCQGIITTPAGTTFTFTDEYRIQQTDGFLLSRSVAVSSPAASDTAFSSRFALANTGSEGLADFDCFMPGVWYGDNQRVPKTALASDYTHEHFYVREDRLPLPMVMLRSQRSGATFSLGHCQPDGSTFLGDAGVSRVVDERLQFGSLGIHSGEQVSAVFLYPGTEGEKTYVRGGRGDRQWALRSHPVRSGVKHAYQLAFRLTDTPGYASAVGDAWRYYFTEFSPAVYDVDLAAVYRDGIGVLDTYASEYDGVPGIPFSVHVPDGAIKDISFQMGFVGQQIPAGYLLLNAGLENNDPHLVAKGQSIIDFWVSDSLTPSGLPRTWYDIHPRRWRDYKTFMRIATDGAEGVLRAWSTMARHQQPRPSWLEYCERFGHWLQTHQNADGSFYRQYDFDDQPLQATKLNTTHPIKFLVDLHLATGKPEYLATAQRAGEFCLKAVHEDYQYVGGTPDNPDVIDKEAGLIAFDAFLALYDATQDKKWLTAAVQAAEFSETWLYCWQVPMVADDTESDYPKNRTTIGLSLIATGHSGADMFMSYYSFQYYRLYLYTGDRHFRDVAKLLLHNTKQTLDWDGSLHYAHRGLQTEAMGIANRRGHSVRVWLPWLTVGTVEPLVQLEETFGELSIDAIKKTALEKRRQQNAAYAKRRNLSLSTSQPDSDQ